MWNSLCICLLILSTSAYGTSRQNTINYTVENVISNDDREFQETQVLEPADRVFIDIMDEAAANDETFRYESIDYGEPLGEYVYEINGLGESRPDQTFWALLERTDSGDCFVPTGVSYYVPEPGVHVVFAYLTYSMSGELPSC